MPPLYWTLPVGLGCGIWHLSWVKGCVWSANAQQSIGSPWWRTAPMPLVWCWTSARNQTHVLTTFYKSIGRSYTYWRLVLLSWSLCWATHKLRFYLTWRTFHLLTATVLNNSYWVRPTRSTLTKSTPTKSTPNRSTLHRHYVNLLRNRLQCYKGHM